MPKIVVVGHGRFNKKNLEPVDPAKRKGFKNTFTVPVGVTLIRYAPDGATLDGASIGFKIDRGIPIESGHVCLEKNGKKMEIPNLDSYPYSSREVINYTLSSPPPSWPIPAACRKVERPVSLKVLVEKLAAEGFTEIHLSCCAAGGGGDDPDIFPWMGCTVMLTNAELEYLSKEDCNGIDDLAKLKYGKDIMYE